MARYRIIMEVEADDLYNENGRDHIKDSGPQTIRVVSAFTELFKFGVDAGIDMDHNLILSEIHLDNADEHSPILEVEEVP